MGLLYGENCIILTSNAFDWCTRVTDRRTDGIAMAYTRYSIYGVTRKNCLNKNWASLIHLNTHQMLICYKHLKPHTVLHGTYTHTHTHTHYHFTALRILSGTTRMSLYQKKHTPTHTYCGHQSSLICFIHLIRTMASSLFNPRAWQSFSTISLYFILRTFFHPIIALFSQNMPIPSQPVLL